MSSDLPSKKPSLFDPASSFLPSYIGSYKIESLLEKGGMSILYLGTHPDTKEPTTIKVLSSKYLSQPDIVKRFLTEAEIIALTDHPNIVKLYGYGEWEGGLYIAMEFIQGISLRQYILQTPLSLKHALEIIIDVSYALCHLHTHGVIHRDLKPENILISENGVVKVIDFGIAQLLTDSPEEQANAQQGFMGTPIYMSPEQRNNPANVGYPSDIYSLGIIAYELIQGKLSLGQIHLSLMPRGLQKILAKSLQPNPADRYQDIVDFISDISAYLHSNALQKEKFVGDQFSEIAESLKQAYKSLLPPPPSWPGIECGIASHKVTSYSLGYYEFFTFPDQSLAIIAGEALAEGVKGMLFTAIMRGIAKGLGASKFSNAQQFLIQYQQVLCRDHIDSFFALSCLLLHPQKNELSYVSFGYGAFMLAPKGKNDFEILNPQYPLIGVDPITDIQFQKRAWNVEDTAVMFLPSFKLSSSDEMSKFLQNTEWMQPLLEREPSSMQKQVENAVRRSRMQEMAFWQSHSVNLLGIYRQPPA